MSVGPSWGNGDVVAGGYRLTQLLGEGGMSQVWEARDLARGHAVALKVGNGASVRSLEAEALTMAAVDHPGLPMVLGVGEHSGAPFIVMERLYGHTLDQLLDDSDELLDVGRVMALLTAVAEVLDAVHRAGYVHGDVKAENVMVCRDGRVVLLDLGLMRRREESFAGGELVCSPHCAAPELIMRTDNSAQRHLADVYAFGVLAYELFCAEAPFIADTLAELLERQLHDAPAPIRFHRDDVPVALEQLVLSMISKQPSARPQSMGAVAETLSGSRRAAEMEEMR